MSEELSGKIINIDGALLDEEQQRSLHGFITCYIDAMKRKAIEDETMKDILDKAKDELQLTKAYVRGAATDLYKLEIGKLNQQAIDDKEAAMAQIREIYEDIEGSRI